MPAEAAAPIVVLSSVDWDEAWQRHQIFASLWAKAGRKVFFVENLGFREPRLSDWRRIKARLHRLARPSKSTRSPRPAGVTVVGPAVLPPTREFFRKLNEAVFIPRLAERLRSLGLADGCVAVCYLPTATTLAALYELKPRAVVYDCVDNFAGHPTPPSDLAQTEAALLARADIVLTTSSTLKAKLERKRAGVLELHQGVPDSFFIDARGRAPAKRLAYFGTVWSALDFEALGALAAAGFEVELIGPVKEDVEALPPGVVSLPPVPHALLPETLGRYDALLLPYARTPYNEGVTPAKLYECLATGLPVLAAPLPALKGLGDVLSFASTPAEWVRAARGLGVDDENRRARRLEAARTRRQSDAFAALQELVEAAVRAPRPAPATEAVTRTRAFLAALAPMGTLILAARAAGFLTILGAGRWLGPDGLGRAAGAAAIGSAVAVLPQLGLPGALTRGLPFEPDERRQGSVISTSLTVFLLAAALWLSALGALRERLSFSLGVSEGLFDLGLLLGYASAFAVVAESPLVGLAKFARRGAVELVAGALIPVCFGLLAWTGRPGHESLVLGWTLALFAAAGVAVASLAPRLRFGFDLSSLSAARRHWAASLFSLAGGSLFFAPQPLLLARAESWEAAGLFAAYACATTLMAAALSEPVGLALGRVADAPMEGAPWRALGWRGAGRVLLAAPALLVLARLVFAALGDRFTFEWATAARFALAGALAAALSAVAARFDAGGLLGARAGAAARMVAGLTNLWLAPGLIEGRGVQGAAEALAGASAAGLAWSALMDGARKVDWLSLRERASRLFSVSRAETTWMAGYYALAKAATMATQIAAGRMLGPEEFGRANVILAGAAFLQTIPMLGFPASVARSVAAADARERPAALSTSTGLFALWTLASLPMLWLLRDPVSRLIGLPHEFWPEAFALAALTAAYTVLAAGLLGHRRLRSRGAVELLYGLAVPVIFFATGNFKDHRGYMLAIAAALALGALVSAIRLRRSFGGVELKEVKPIFAYALVAALNYLATALVLAPGRLHLGAVSGSEQVGAFSAYFSATMQIALAVSTLASSALLPMATGRENQQLARTRISEQWLPGWLVSFAGFTAAGGAALALFGSDYPMRAGLLVLFGAAAATHLLQSLVSTVLAASGLRGLAFAVAANVSAGAVNALACPFLIARYGLAGAALALLLGFVVGSGICAAGKALTRE